MNLLARLVADIDLLRTDYPCITEIVIGYDPSARADPFVADRSDVVTWFMAGSSGAANVRNELAIRSSGDLLAFLDDDVTIAETWGLALKHAAHGAAAFWAGAIDDNGTSPSSGRLREQIGKKDFGPVMRPLSSQEHAAGANLIISRALFNELGGFRPIFGGRNEDVDLHRRASAKTAVMWLPDLRVTHLLPQSEASFNWRAQGQSDGFVDCDLVGRVRLCRTLIGLFRWMVYPTPPTYSVGYMQGMMAHQRRQAGD
ncbi:hypothetical protein [Amycolatopsis solani]|uniref:hypothetical protein n=1 Tax=Amycolatopsis solani TaxID=3028615 RepID=UPI0025AF1342|nr:hypothetical protein [Amycolatopsis sp. MEP2-6]